VKDMSVTETEVWKC